MLRPETTSFVNLVHNIPSAFSTSRQEGKVLETAIVANTITAHTFCCRKSSSDDFVTLGVYLTRNARGLHLKPLPKW